MFRKVKHGFLPVLSAFGPSPFETWKMKVGPGGCIRRISDEAVRALVLEILSTNVSTTFLNAPINPRNSLGIYMPILVMIIKDLKKSFSFEITIVDDKRQNRRFRWGTFQRRHQIDHFCTALPICLKCGWNEVCFDLQDLTRKAYGSNYMETKKMQINANCRIRVIYFCDKIYDESETPQKYKLFLPNEQKTRRSSKDEKPTVKDLKVLSVSSIAAEEGEEEEEEEEEHHDQKLDLFLNKAYGNEEALSDVIEEPVLEEFASGFLLKGADEDADEDANFSNDDAEAQDVPQKLIELQVNEPQETEVELEDIEDNTDDEQA